MNQTMVHTYNTNKYDNTEEFKKFIFILSTSKTVEIISDFGYFCGYVELESSESFKFLFIVNKER